MGPRGLVGGVPIQVSAGVGDCYRWGQHPLILTPMPIAKARCFCVYQCDRSVGGGLSMCPRLCYLFVQILQLLGGG